MKNTFLEFEGDSDEAVTAADAVARSPPRSRSADAQLCRKPSDEHLQLQLSLEGEIVSGELKPVDTTPLREEPCQPLARVLSHGRCHTQGSSPIHNQCPSVSETTAATVPSVEELRRLQEKLSHATGRRPGLVGNSSFSSMSTIAGPGRDGAASGQSPLHHVWSSGTVSSMLSDQSHDNDERRVEESAISAAVTPLASSLEVHVHSPVADLRGRQKVWVPPGLVRPVQVVQQARPKECAHSRVPKNVNLAEEFSRQELSEPPTTMMVRNIPNRYTQVELIQECEDLGFAGTFDFFYVPVDRGTMNNVGYAFVNFLTDEWARKSMQVFENYSFKKYQRAREKIAAVSVAHIQGLAANLRHYENAVVGLTPARAPKHGGAPALLRNRASNSQPRQPAEL